MLIIVHHSIIKHPNRSGNSRKIKWKSAKIANFVIGGDRVENALCRILEYPVSKEVKNIVEMIDERADASAKWTS